MSFSLLWCLAYHLKSLTCLFSESIEGRFYYTVQMTPQKEKVM